MQRIGKYDAENKRIIEYGDYYDALDLFNRNIKEINGHAAEGATLKRLQESLKKLAPAFLHLCGRNEKNVLLVREGWGICPVCGQKNIKVRSDTVLINYPMYCKRCKCDHVVSWSAV